jgi:hypothetical protein
MPPVSDARVRRVVLGGSPAEWQAAGFALAEGGTINIGSVAIEPAGERRGMSWELAGVGTTDLDGLDTVLTDAGPAEPGTHPNGVTSIDHVVSFTPDLDRTITALEAAGLSLRRIREEPTPAGAPRQAFFRLGEVILEVVQQPAGAPGFDPAGPARLWGLAFNCSDLDAAAAQLGELAKGPRDAVQPGRRILTLSRGAGLSVPVAFMSSAS